MQTDGHTHTQTIFFHMTLLTVEGIMTILLDLTFDKVGELFACRNEVQSNPSTMRNTLV